MHPSLKNNIQHNNLVKEDINALPSVGDNIKMCRQNRQIKFKYSVLTYNFNNYEKLHEIVYPELDVEYIYVTDDKNITSSTWTIIYDEKLQNLSAFEKCYYVRFHPFEYVSTDIVVRLDGSFNIIHGFSDLVVSLNENNADYVLTPHPNRYNIHEEYNAWIRIRGYSQKDAINAQNYIINKGFDIHNNKGLIQENFVIQKNNALTRKIDEHIFTALKEINKPIERIDQTITSFILQHYYKNDVKIVFISPDVPTDNYHAQSCFHNSYAIVQQNTSYQDITFFFNNKDVNITKIQPRKNAVIVHVYYIDIWWNYIYPRLKELPFEYDLYIAITDNNSEEDIEKIKNTCQTAKEIIIVENLGEDIRSFIQFINKISTTDIDYDYVLKLHTKKSDLIQLQRLLNSVFQQITFDNMKNSNYGLLSSKHYLCQTQNGEIDTDYFNEISDMIDNKTMKFYCVYGTMFWIKYSILKQYIGNKCKYTYFDQKYANKGTKMHSMERILGAIVKDAGFSVLGL